MDQTKLDPNTRDQLHELSQEERLAKLETEVQRLDKAITATTMGSINAQNMAKMALDATKTPDVGYVPEKKKSLLQRLLGR